MLVASAGVTVAFVWAWTGAHCQPVPQCQSEAEWRGLLHLALLLGIAAPLGFLVRWITRSVARACPDRLLLSTTISILIMLPLVWAAYESVMLGIEQIP